MKLQKNNLSYEIQKSCDFGFICKKIQNNTIKIYNDLKRQYFHTNSSFLIDTFQTKKKITKKNQFRRNFIEFDPHVMICCCLFLSSKVEESFVRSNVIVISLTSLAKVTNKEFFLKIDMNYKAMIEKSMMEYEFILLGDLKFDLTIYHPFNDLQIIFSDIMRRNPSHMLQMQLLMERSWSIINDCFRSEITLFHEPYLIALGIFLFLFFSFFFSFFSLFNSNFFYFFFFISVCIYFNNFFQPLEYEHKKQ